MICTGWNGSEHHAARVGTTASYSRPPNATASRRSPWRLRIEPPDTGLGRL